MAGYVIIGSLAAFGLLSAVWVLLGLLLPVSGGFLIASDISLARRYLWMRELGLLRCPLYVMDHGLSDGEKAWLHSRDIEICGFSEPDLELETIDGTGNGDSAGRHQCCDLPEL